MNPEQSHTDSATPLVSVIVPCREEAASAARCLDSVLQSSPPTGASGEWMEILVVDGMSAASTRKILAGYASQHAAIRILDNPDRITPMALNRGIAEARGTYIQRVDAHSTLAPDYIAKAVATLQATGAWGVGGAMETSAELREFFGPAIQTTLSHRFGVGNSRFRTTGGDAATGAPREADTIFNACWRASVFAEIGTFDPRLARSQDIDLSARIRRAGGRLLLNPSMHTTYFSKSTMRAFLKQNWNNGVWALLPAAYLDEFPMSLRHLVPGAFLSVLLVLALGAGIGLLPGGLFAAASGGYLVTSLLASLHGAVTNRSIKLLWQLPLTFAGIHFSYGLGSLWGAIRVAGLWLTTSHDPDGGAPNPVIPVTSAQPRPQKASAKGASV